MLSVIEDGWICWSTGNHDFKRVISRINPYYPNTKDIALYAMALGLSLRGSFCIYQGEELGLSQAELAFEDLVDPYDIMLYPEHVGRDGCRTPMPWIKNAPHAGFSSTMGKTWLPVYDRHLEFAVDKQEKDEESILNAFRHFLTWRRNHPSIRLGDIDILETADPVLAYRREHESEAILCVFNTDQNEESWELPEQYEGYLYLEGMSHNTRLKNGKISFKPYGYAFLKRAG